MDNLPLFDIYPNKPGHKGFHTSRAAAEKISRKASTIRDKVEAWFRAGNTGSGEQCAQAIGLPKHTVRSRCSELAGQGILEDSGLLDNTTESGLVATVWKLKK